MQAGRLNTRVHIRGAAETNTSGSYEITYPSTAARGSRWAEKRGLSVTERFRAQQLDANAEYAFTFRNDSVTRAISVKDRLLTGATSSPGEFTWYDIVGAYDPDGKRRIVQVWATARHED